MDASRNPDDAKTLRCPICDKDSAERYRPFCSKRCADIDLGKWFSGSYAISRQSNDEEEDGDSPERGRSAEGTDER